MKKIALYLLAGTVLLGCGGDDSDSNSTTNPNPNPDPTQTVTLMPGFYEGTDDEDELLYGLVDDDRKLWITYIEILQPSGDENLAGFMKTNESVLLNNDKFTALGKNYSYDGSNSRSSSDITITGNYKASAISGTFFEQPSNPISYNLKFDTSAFKKHTFTQIDNKTFTGPLNVTSSTGTTAATLIFTNNGSFTGSDSQGCTITGKFTPAASGRYYISTVVFGQINCAAAGETLTGVSILDDSDDNLALSATNNTGRGMFFGS
ncbi:hypothetical protein [Psychrobacter sp. DAB_AL43B]|uniref:hypothetical protein n=1 Tax=Psychrobacter sp. DAB_AL43B TaxID=1028416 RepID=UPI0009A8FFBA|nr:hypothetical protein [Psychrobacter sp. DAB_AL43B]SLJ85301.1 hypothetical protein DABAL43B_2114 [Psychrobacter sp. DAB_AL43B]